MGIAAIVTVILLMAMAKGLVTLFVVLVLLAIVVGLVTIRKGG